MGYHHGFGDWQTDEAGLACLSSQAFQLHLDFETLLFSLRETYISTVFLQNDGEEKSQKHHTV